MSGCFCTLTASLQATLILALAKSAPSRYSNSACDESVMKSTHTITLKNIFTGLGYQAAAAAANAAYTAAAQQQQHGKPPRNPERRPNFTYTYPSVSSELKPW